MRDPRTYTSVFFGGWVWCQINRHVGPLAAATFVVAVVVFVVQELIEPRMVPTQQLSTDSHGHQSRGYTPEDGPNMWPIMFHACSGRQQSPVNIVRKSVVTNPKTGNASALSFRWTPLKSRYITNTGHGIQVRRTPDARQTDGRSSGPVGYR